MILLGTAEQVRLAAEAANAMVAGRDIETAALVRSLRDFIREVLDLDAVPAGMAIPNQGPLRAAAAGGRSGGGGSGGNGGGRGGGGGGGGAGMAAGGMLGLGSGHAAHDSDVLQGPDVPTLVLHGDDDQIVPIADSALRTVDMVKGATLKVYAGAPHGLCTTRKDEVSADLLKFFSA